MIFCVFTLVAVSCIIMMMIPVSKNLPTSLFTIPKGSSFQKYHPLTPTRKWPLPPNLWHIELDYFEYFCQFKQYENKELEVILDIWLETLAKLWTLQGWRKGYNSNKGWAETGGSNYFLKKIKSGSIFIQQKSGGHFFLTRRYWDL